LTIVILVTVFCSRPLGADELRRSTCATENGAAKLNAQDETPSPQEPNIAAPSDEGEKVLGSIKAPKSWKVNLFAAEPLVANPVSFDIDSQGRVWVCESFRQVKGRGIEDNRSHPEWLDDDLAAQTVADRLAYIWTFAN
jgi:quinoprotein glucose dehydrogenase